MGYMLITSHAYYSIKLATSSLGSSNLRGVRADCCDNTVQLHRCNAGLGVWQKGADVVGPDTSKVRHRQCGMRVFRKKNEVLDIRPTGRGQNCAVNGFVVGNRLVSAHAQCVERSRKIVGEGLRYIWAGRSKSRSQTQSVVCAVQLTKTVRTDADAIEITQRDGRLYGRQICGMCLKQCDGRRNATRD